MEPSTVSTLDPSSMVATPQPVSNYSASEEAAIRVYAQWHTAVAHISVRDADDEAISEGSAFLWDTHGHLLTNAHVVDGGAHFTATFLVPKKHSIDATLIGVDKCRDVAVIHVLDPPITDVLGGAIGALAQVGQRAHALGAPFGLSHSLTVGVVSAIGRELTVRRSRPPLFDLIQTDAAMNRGCSGGPVLSSTGAVLGMTVAIATPSGAFAGVGFAIPFETLRASARELIASQGARAPPCVALGVVLAPRAALRTLRIPDGLLVLSTRKDGPASRAGMRGTVVLPGGGISLGDVIVRVGDVPVSVSADVWRELRHRSVGDRVDVAVRRSGVGELVLNVELMDMHDVGEDAIAERRQSAPRSRL